MNELSWLIYAADVAGSVGFGISTVFVLSMLVLAGTLLAVPFSEGEVMGKDIRQYWFKCLVWSSSFVAFSFFLGAAVPSQETVYAIAASEMGERVIQSETGGKAVDALNAWLDRQIAPPATPPT